MTAVGIFDSGVGGLSVLAEFRRLAPEHPVIYLADQAWAPYGERSLDEVRDRSVMIARDLINSGCELVVVACNSASAAALHHLRGVFPETQFVGMEPAVKPAASQSERGVIGVLATNATFQGELYSSVVDRHGNGAQIVEQACPGLADAVERLGVDATETLRLVERYVAPLRDAGVDTLVLGCTHYPFLLDAVEDVAGPGVTVIDPAPAVARQTMRLLGDPEMGGNTVFLTTGDAGVFAAQIRTLLDEDTQPHSTPIAISRHRIGATQIAVAVADLTAQAVGAIVNAANDRLQHGGGVAAAIVRAGGAIIQEQSNTWLSEHGPVEAGHAAVTTAGAMPAHHVIHVAGPVYRAGQDNQQLLRLAVAAALDAAEDLEVPSVAFPAISAGVYGYPLDEATAVLADEVVRWVAVHPDGLGEVRLVALDPHVADRFAVGLDRAVVRLRSEPSEGPAE
ncbi:MAG: glutamate racemase [Acidimicrobiia bacterium]|nr:glutamate racemase [Acidimicrobiia bacterium]MDX2466439.1 glutamate racemase [Acidimicrobiia bacterium]